MPKSIRKNKGERGDKGIVYLDYAASASPNPSSIHRLGVRAREELAQARQAVRDILHARPEEIIFTSGGTEGNNMAIQGTIYGAKKQGFFPHIVTTNIEHPSVLETCRLLEQRGLAEISIVPVEPNGIVDPKKIRKAITSHTVLVSVMYANNEIGTVQPIKEIAREIRHYRKNAASSFPFFHTDAVQAVQYLSLNADALGVDMLTLSGSKIEGAGRVGVLFKKRSVPLASMFGGGDQEQGIRPGTENLEAIVKFSSALANAEQRKEKESKRLAGLRDYFLEKIVRQFPDAVTNGDTASRLPNNISITFPKIPSDLLVIELSAKGIMCSSKSACKSSRAEGSYVIAALRPDADQEIGGLRFSLGSETSKKDLDRALKALDLILKKLKRWYN